MNKYIIPVCDLVEATVSLYKISARTLSECQEKLMQKFSDTYDIDGCNYREFLNTMDKEYNIAIGEITDIETL